MPIINDEYKNKKMDCCPTIRAERTFTISEVAKSTNTQEQSQPITTESNQSGQMQKQLMFQDFQTSTFSLSDGLVRITQLLDNEPDKEKVLEVVYLVKQLESCRLKNPTILLLKTCQDSSLSMKVATSTQQLDCSPTLGMTFNGKFLIQGGFSPKIESGYTLSDILEQSPDLKYFLSEKQVEHIMKISMQLTTALTPIITKDG